MISVVQTVLLSRWPTVKLSIASPYSAAGDWKTAKQFTAAAIVH
jgi:hypothetical protein